MRNTKLLMMSLLGAAALTGVVAGGFWAKKKKNRIFAKFLKCYRKEKQI